MRHQQPVQSSLDALIGLAQIFFMLPVMVVVTVAVFGLLAYELGLPDGNVGAYFLHDAHGPLISMIVYVLAIMAVPPILRALSDPEWAKLETRQTVWAFTAIAFGLLQQVAQPLEWLGHRTTSLTVLTTPLGSKLAIQRQPSLPPLSFLSGTSPQLE